MDNQIIDNTQEVKDTQEVKANWWEGRRVCVTGGGAMIGSALVKMLKAENPKNLFVVDDWSSGRRENLGNDVYCITADLRNYKEAKAALRNADVVIHLACLHGGRGYVDSHFRDCYTNLGLDASVFRACQENSVSKVFFMSSACAYPIAAQNDPANADVKITEDVFDYNNFQQPDGAYGFSKAAAEVSLMQYAKDGIFDVAIGRGFTVYGELVKPNHAIGSLIAKSFVKLDPYPIWGDGRQRRNWGYVSDIARGILLATEKLHNDVVNLGVEEYHTPNDVCEILWELLKWRPKEIVYQTDKPVGALNRVADASKAKELLGWTPEISFKDGLLRTLVWFMKTHTVEEVAMSLERSLTER